MSTSNDSVVLRGCDLQEALDLSIKLARAAGEVVRRAWGDGTERQGGNSVNFKDPTDLVTDVDKQCEALIIGGIRERYPDHAFVAEEDVSAGGSEEALPADGRPAWCVDPIDGTANFVHRIPFVSIAIGLNIEGECVVGVVYNPILDEMFTGRQGGGAFLNGKPVHVSPSTDLVQAMVGIASGQGVAQATAGRNSEFQSRLRTVIKRCRSWRRCGSAALDVAYVACGRLDLYMERGPHAWDVCAGVAILKEAGGVASGIDGSKLDICSGHIMAGNATLGKTFLEALEEDNRLEG